MLIEFSVTNFKSIKDKVTLSMVASPDKEHPENTFEVEGRKFNLLKSVALYGANASGKSNLIDAFSFMRSFVLNSAESQRGRKIPIKPFKLDRETISKPSEFEVAFIKDGERYIYGFSVDSEKVHEEWLTAAKTSRSRELFTRTLEGKEYKYSFGKTWKGEKENLQKSTRDNALFLSVAVQFNNPTAKPVFDWFKDYVERVISSQKAFDDFRINYTNMLLSRGDINKATIIKHLQIADLGIENFDIFKIKWEEIDDDSEMPEDWKGILQKLEKLVKSELEVSDEEDEPLLLSMIKTMHKIYPESDKVEYAELDLRTEESSGTQKYYALLGPWILMMLKGGIMMIDEFDTSLHPLLSQYLVKLIHKSKADSAPVQVIFTTHDSSLLDSDLFRRDQIWFTEKDKYGATQAYSLWDYKNVRSNENFRSGYLQGRYGAIPFIGEFKFE